MSFRQSSKLSIRGYLRKYFRSFQHYTVLYMVWFTHSFNDFALMVPHCMQQSKTTVSS